MANHNHAGHDRSPAIGNKELEAGTMVGLRIRHVRLDDAETIVSILNPIIEAGQYTVLDTTLTVEAERQFITSFPQRGLFFLAERLQDGQVLGFQSLEPFATFTQALDHVAVIGTYIGLPYRQQGIGRRLSQVTFEAARHKGYEKVCSYVRADNFGALAFYLRLGFRIIGTDRNVLAGIGCDHAARSQE